jgi:hypothetical protein
MNLQYNNQYTNMPTQTFSVMNPRNFDQKIKNSIVNQNIYHAGYGNYKVCPMCPSIKFPYRSSYNPNTINNVCKVLVCNKHPLDVANTLCDHGLNSLTSRKPIPAIMYPLGSEFMGSNFESREGIYDENIVLRTNYAYVIKKQLALFSGKDDKNIHTVVYSNPITVIRDMNYNPYNHDDIYKVSVITLCYERKNELVNENALSEEKDKENKILSSADLINLQIYIETVFQIAICGYHEVLLLTLFGREFGVPVDDQILIFNNIIMKYGHKFKGIMICIPPYEGKDIYEYFDKEIIRPQSLVENINNKYNAEEMAQRMNDGNAGQVSDDKLKLLKKIIQKKKNK